MILKTRCQFVNDKHRYSKGGESHRVHAPKFLEPVLISFQIQTLQKVNIQKQVVISKTFFLFSQKSLYANGDQ